MDDSLMKKDAEHHKLQAAHNAPAAVAKAMAMNDPTMQRKRGKMMLPAPQVSNKHTGCLRSASAQGVTTLMRRVCNL
jgi:hypothetical protein